MAPKSKYESIFSPGKIGSLTTRNRIILPATGTTYIAEDGYVTDRLINYHRARAKGGVGLNIVEVACVETPIGKIGARQLYIDNDRFLPGLRKLVQAIHQEGSKAAIQLHHAGAASRNIYNGGELVSASNIQRGPFFDVPRPMTVSEIKHTVACFANAAARAREAGFDGVEIHAAHFYLLQQFLSRTFNRREDQYGGSLENRARFLLEVIRAVRDTVGRDYPVWYRINSSEVEGGFTPEEARQAATLTEAAGTDAVNVSTTLHDLGSGYAPKGYNLPATEEIKKGVKVPVFAVGCLNIEIGDKAIKQGQTDFVCLGRTLIADPDLPAKFAGGKAGEVRPCIHCMRCMFEDVFLGKPLECSVNASVGHEAEYELKPVSRLKRVMVVGGGPGGMETARVAALRGHKVTLYDRQDKLGGQLLVADKPPCKSDLTALAAYLAGQVRKLDVEINLGQEVTPALVADIKPDVVVLATGTFPLTLKIPGIERKSVVTAEDVLLAKVEVGTNVAVVGGGLVGCETAHLLVEKGKKVTIVEMLPEMAARVTMVIRMDILRILQARGVTMMTNTRVAEITSSGLIVTDASGNQGTLSADNVILATGALANRQLAESLRGKVPELHLIGDAKEPRFIKEAIAEGFQVGRSL